MSGKRTTLLQVRMIPEEYAVGALTVDPRNPAVFRAVTAAGEHWVFEFLKEQSDITETT